MKSNLATITNNYAKAYYQMESAKNQKDFENYSKACLMKTNLDKEIIEYEQRKEREKIIFGLTCAAIAGVTVYSICNRKQAQTP